MRRALGTALLTIAFAAAPCAAQPGPESAALAGWDDETGIWFPPDAPRQTYLDRSDPEHPLIKDVEKALKADAALAQAVAALATDPRHQPNAGRLSGPVRQLKTMFDMLVVGLAASRREAARDAEVTAANERSWETWLDLDAARARPLEERRAEWQTLSDEADGARDHDARMRLAFRMLGLLPQAELSTYRVLRWSGFVGTLAEAKLTGFLRRIAEREGAEGRPGAGPWRMALRNLEFDLGEVERARSLSRALLGMPELVRWESDNRLFAGLLDRLAGDGTPLRAALDGCVVPESAAAAWEGRAPAYCRALAHELAVHLLDAGAKAPRTLAAFFEEDAAAAPGDFAHRVDCARHIERLDPARARALAEEVLRLPATLVPLGARVDAFAVAGRSAAAQKEWPAAQAAWDRYLAALRYTPVPLPANAWARVAAVPRDEPGARAPDAEGGWLEISYGLQRKAEAAIAARDFPLARKSVAALTAAALAFVDSAGSPASLEALVDLGGATAEERKTLTELLATERAKVEATGRDQLRYVRWLLRDLGNAALAAGRKDDARRIAGYLITSPEKEGALFGELAALVHRAREDGTPIAPASSPF